MGVKHGLDLFRILVLSFADANAGGVTRSALAGAVPPRHRRLGNAIPKAASLWAGSRPNIFLLILASLR
jgi:uncharacterized membrane protein YeiH